MDPDRLLPGLALFLGILFLLLPEPFYGPDYPVYPAYIQSVVEDGDLNIVNNLSLQDPDRSCGERLSGVEVTPTFNSADFHNHGGVLFWIPFYTYGKAVSKLAGWVAPDSDPAELQARVLSSALSFSTVFCAFLACVLTVLMTAQYFGVRIAFWSVMTVFWGSPVFFYTICEPGNANIPALLLSTIIVITAAYVLTAANAWPPVLFGMLFAIAMAVKLDLWFVGIFIGAGMWVFWTRGRRTAPATVVRFALGVVLAGWMKPINDYLKYGSSHLGEAGLIDIHDAYHWEQLFSPYHGYFSTSPLLPVCLFGLVVMAVCRGWRRQGGGPSVDERGFFRLVLVMSCWLGITIFIIGFRFAWGGGTFGARQLNTLFPFFVLLMAYLMNWARRWPWRWLRVAAAIFLLVLIGINWLHAGEFLAEEPIAYYLQAVPWKDVLTHFGDLWFRLQEGIAAVPVKLFSLPLLVGCGWLGWMIVRQVEVVSALLSLWGDAPHSPEADRKTGRIGKWVAVLSLTLVAGYGLVTGLNVRNNRQNVARMQGEGCFRQVRVLTQTEFEEDENAASLAEMIYYFWRKGDVERAKRIKALRERLYPDKTLDEFWWGAEIR